jgi:hypothetical protein
MTFPTLYTPTIDFTLLAATSVLFIGAVLTVETPSLRRWVLPTMGCGTLAAASLLLNLRWLFPAAIPIWLAPFSHSVLEFAKIYHLLYAIQTLVARDAELDPLIPLMSNHIVHIFVYDFLLSYGHAYITGLLLIQSIHGFLQAVGRLLGANRRLILLQSYTRLAASLWLLYQYWTLNIPATVFGFTVVTNCMYHSFKYTYPYSQTIMEPMV